eukprot:scaffold60372_cov21-Tisochrysis_lutea.AAC.3
MLLGLSISMLSRMCMSSYTASRRVNNEKLHILAEHSSIFTELISEHKVQQAFNFAGPNAQALKYFRDPLLLLTHGLEGVCCKALQSLKLSLCMGNHHCISHNASHWPVRTFGSKHCAATATTIMCLAKRHAHGSIRCNEPLCTPSLVVECRWLQLPHLGNAGLCVTGVLALLCKRLQAVKTFQSWAFVSPESWHYSANDSKQSNIPTTDLCVTETFKSCMVFQCRISTTPLHHTTAPHHCIAHISAQPSAGDPDDCDCRMHGLTA